MQAKQEIVQIKLEEHVQHKHTLPTKVAVRIKSDNQDIFVCNDANQYLVQTVLKELISDVS